MTEQVNLQEESQELFESTLPPDQINEDELIAELLREENEKPDESNISNKKQNRFPLARIKLLMKMDPDLNIVSQEAVSLVAKATELFLKNLAKESYSYTAKAKRKTVQRRDLDAAVENIDALCFLEGALDT